MKEFKEIHYQFYVKYVKLRKHADLYDINVFKLLCKNSFVQLFDFTASTVYNPIHFKPTILIKYL